MAGIGFRLRQMTEQGTIAGLFQGYSYSAIIMAGPWLLTVLTVATVAGVGDGTPRFQLYITHVFPLSLMYLGFVQFPITRYLADRIYANERDYQVGSLNSALLIGLLPMLVLGIAWAWFTPSVSLAERIAAVSLLLCVTAEWVLLLYVVVMDCYGAILWAFFVGDGASFFLGSVWGFQSGDLGATAGFAVGQGLGLGLLLRAFMREFPAPVKFDLGFWDWCRKAPSLALAGGIYYLGGFIDKFVFRYTSGAPIVEPWLWGEPFYEEISFMAQLTVVPAMAIFFLKVETDFYEYYRAFYDTIEERGTLEEITHFKSRLIVAMKRGFGTTLKVQGMISFLIILTAPELLPGVRLEGYTLRLFRVLVIGDYLHIMVLFCLVIMLYFEFYRDAFHLALVFALFNFVLTSWTVAAGSAWHGWGLVGGGAVALAFGFYRLFGKVENLEYYTFSKSRLRYSWNSNVGVEHDLGKLRASKK